MARIVALVPDLMFGSKVQAMLTSAGHEVGLVSTEAEARAQGAGADLLVVDLTTDVIDGVAIVQALRADGSLAATPALAFYSHVEPDVKARAEGAGLELVVPRSRMAREGAALAQRMLDAAPAPG